MKKNTLRHAYEVVSNNIADISTFLMDLANCDCDFNGENGLEYLWDEAKGFESNAEYCLSVAMKESTTTEMVEKFVSMWMGNDYYYDDYDIGVIVQDDKLFISLAYTTEF